MGYSRRDLLRGGLAGGAIATAGCSGILSGGGSDSCPDTQEDCETQVVGQTITEDTTWGPSQGCYKYELDGNVPVEGGATLTVEPGTRVLVNEGHKIAVQGDSAIVAEGAEGCPIEFKGTAETAGHWDGIILGIDTGNERNRFSYCDIAHGGNSPGQTNLTVTRDATVSVENCTFRASSKPGLWLKPGARFNSFSSNTFSNNEGPALQIPAPALDSLDSASTYADGNTHDRVRVTNETITEDGTWANLGAPIHFGNNGNVEASVTVEAGATIQVGQDQKLTIHNDGVFAANGESGNEVTIRGASDQKGYWEALVVNSAQSGNQLRHTTVRNGGQGPRSTNVELSENGRMGFENVTFERSSGYGLRAYPGTELLSFSDNTFRDNGRAGIQVTARMIPTLDSASTYAGNNGDDRIEILNEEVQESATWKPLGVHFHFVQNAVINNTLSIQKDTVMEFSEDTVFSVVREDGKVTASGNMQQNEPVVFRGSKSEQGHWQGIRINTDEANGFSDCVLSDGGPMLVVDNGASAGIVGCRITNIQGNGLVELRGASMTNRQNSFGNLTGEPVMVRGKDN